MTTQERAPSFSEHDRVTIGLAGIPGRVVDRTWAPMGAWVYTVATESGLVACSEAILHVDRQTT